MSQQQPQQPQHHPHDEDNHLLPSDREQRDLRALNRSPHPYHHASTDLAYAADRLNPHPASPAAAIPPALSHQLYVKDSSPASESGTEADDEHFLKGLPASRTRLHKGLRGAGAYLSGSSSPLPSPPIQSGDDRALPTKGASSGSSNARGARRGAPDGPKWSPSRVLRTHYKAISQRAAELANVIALGLMVRSNHDVSPLLTVWGRDYRLLGLLYTLLLTVYPLRVVAWAYRSAASAGRRPTSAVPLRVPPSPDPAPILYPPAITTAVSLLVATDNPAVILPNIVLSICSFPQALIPRFEPLGGYNSLHWALSCLPLVWTATSLGSSSLLPQAWTPDRSASAVASAVHASLTDEDMTLLYPLHQTLCTVLHHLTTTSLLTAELQLLSIALINVLLLTSSPQAKVLKSLLWVGGVGILVTCGPAIRAGIHLARVPKWRFRRVPGHHHRRPLWKELSKIFSWKRIKSEFFSSPDADITDDPTGPGASSDSDSPEAPGRSSSWAPPRRVQTASAAGLDSSSPAATGSTTFEPSSLSRSQTLTYAGRNGTRGHTPSGRRKRAMSGSLRPLARLTYSQAVIRKWLYALYVYAAMAGVILAGVRTHMQLAVFGGRDPIGWALGYLLGDLPTFRFQVVRANLERWICLPARHDARSPGEKQCMQGLVPRLRGDVAGEANTRLILAGYWLGILVVGLLTVIRLSSVYEVDTRRKVFHFMMVGMLLPGTFVDPAYVALALSMVLAVFLLLDLVRASQLPPLSRPIASFLAPYVDGRDFRGPVVISHIFLLIGCAVPLWLALATLPRSTSSSDSSADCSRDGWEIPLREVSMVSGVVCVGLGDAAASLVGRRFGRRKWLWGGGKSIEGSLAFAAAVVLGLGFAKGWLVLGGWPSTLTPPATAGTAGSSTGGGNVLGTTGRMAACASMASLTEAVLTGGNDNVIVPVVLWTCVKSLGI